jgi:GT2 family glycosyltransferase
MTTRPHFSAELSEAGARSAAGVQKSRSQQVLPRVSVIIVTYRSITELPGCLDSVLNQALPIEVFLVDNASPDGTRQMVSDYAANIENVHAILNTENLGLAAGNNCPLRECQGEYVLILNPDTLLPKDNLVRMVEFLDKNKDIGVLGPKCVYEDGTPHVSFHRHWGILHVLAWRIFPYRFVRYFYDRFSSYRFQDVLFVSGACLMIRRSIFEQIGGYDPEYFLTVEDAIDLCIRARNAEGRVVFFPDAEVIHFTGRSATQTPYLVVWQGIRGTVYHFLKHKGVPQALLVSLLIGVASAVRVAIAAILGIGQQQYRAVARIYAGVLRDLLLRNPIRTNGSAPRAWL